MNDTYDDSGISDSIYVTFRDIFFVRVALLFGQKHGIFTTTVPRSVMVVVYFRLNIDPQVQLLSM